MKRRVIVAAFGCLGVVFASGQATAQQFSAELVPTGSEGGHSTSIHVADGKLRMEGGTGREGYVVADSKAGTSYVVMPKQHMYMDMAAMGGGRMMQMLMPADPNDACAAWKEAAKNSHEGEAIASCHRIGPDTVDGRRAIKYEGTTRKGERGFAWVDAKLRFMLKTEMSGGKGMELRNIQEGPQPADLFAIPADFQKADMKSLMERYAKPQN